MKILDSDHRNFLLVLVREYAGLRSMSRLAGIHDVCRTKKVADSLEDMGFVALETRSHYVNDFTSETTEIYCLTKKGGKYLSKWIMARFKKKGKGEP